MSSLIYKYHPLSSSNLDSLTKKICSIVLSTGSILTDEKILSIKQKEGHANFVTDMDVRIQQELVTQLTPLLPDASFILEEQDIQPALSEYTWIIDPIDGTQNYIKNYNQSAISIALLHQSTGVIGIVYNPFSNELFVGIKDQGATLNHIPIHASESGIENSIICFGTSPYYPLLAPKALEALRALFEVCGDFRRSGSAALDLCYTACGRSDGYFEYSLSPWDYAAASIIIREAGGEIAAISSPVWDYTKQTGIIAGSRNLFPDLKRIIEK